MVTQIKHYFRGAAHLFVPVFWRKDWTYSKETFKEDAVAGVTVAIIQIPQTMALASIAGLPPVYGLYASLVGFVASVWGSSNVLSTGPVAVVSFLTLTSIVPLAVPGTQEYITLATLLAFMVGIIYLAIGFFRWGYILQLVPHSVIAGFTSATAAVIVVTQIPVLAGIKIGQHDLVFESILNVIAAIPHASPPALAVGLVCVLFLVMTKVLPRTFPSTLIALVTATFASFAFQFSSYGISIVGEIPSGLPSFALPWLGTVAFFSLISKASIIALVGFVQAHSIATLMARKEKRTIDTNQELVGQGLANIVGSFFHAFPMCGSITRTAVNSEAGARTAVAAIISAAISGLAILFLAPFFYYVPTPVLAAIVIVSAYPLIQFSRLREMYTISATDGFVALLTFAIAFLLKPDDAIFIGVLVALMLFIRRTVFGVFVTEMGIDTEWNVVRGLRTEYSVSTIPHAAVIRVGSALYYANSTHIIEMIESALAEHLAREGEAKKLILDASGINFIDITGIEVLAQYIESLAMLGIPVAFIYMRVSVRDTIRRDPHFPHFTVLNNIAEMRSWCA